MDKFVFFWVYNYIVLSYIRVIEHNGDILSKNHVFTITCLSKCTTKTACCS